MGDTEYILMRVQWGEQRRQIKVQTNNDINAIRKATSNTYQLQQVNNLDGYQIQYYDSNFEEFMDLYPDTFDLFQQLLNKLLSPEAPPKSAKEWDLRIVPKAIQTIRPAIHQSMTDDTYSYQQENDPAGSLQNEESSTVPDNTQSTSVSSGSRSNNPKTLLRDPTLQINNQGQQETVRPAVQPPALITVNSQLMITYDHPCSLDFDDLLADEQRQQYESEMTRGGSSRSAIGGVLLRASHKSDIKSYPAVHFKIPDDKLHLPWSLHICILTEADKNGNHYLHASKGIYDHDTKREDKFGVIPNSESFNPYVVLLTQEQIRDGKYPIYIKVCNMKNVRDHERLQLRDFSRLSGTNAYDDRALLSEKTTRNLKLTSAKYHVGCILFCGDIVYDRCVSSLTTAVSNKKRNDIDQTTPCEDESDKKKSKLT